MKVKVNIIHTRCTLVSEAITVPSLTMMTSTVSEESLARNTHIHTHGLGSLLKLAKIGRRMGDNAGGKKTSPRTQREVGGGRARLGTK